MVHSPSHPPANPETICNPSLNHQTCHQGAAFRQDPTSNHREKPPVPWDFA